MVNTALLLNAITRCGKTILDCAAALGVSKKTMKRKIKRSWMTTSEDRLFCQQVELFLQSGIPL